MWPYLTNGQSAKGIDRCACIIVAGIGVIFAKNTCISSTCVIGTWIGYFDIKGICTRGILPRVLLLKVLSIENW